MKNPPLSSYFLAAVASLAGGSERALHVAFLLPALGAIWGTWFLARFFCRQPVGAALLALATPAFVVSSTNVMCDTAMLCLWTWAIGLWIKGMKTGLSRWLALASLLIAAAALTKYFAVSLIPLMAVDTVLRERKITRRLAWLLAPLLLLAGYQLWTWRLYGRGLLSDAADFSWRIAAVSGPGVSFSQETVDSKILVALSFAGGSFLPILYCAYWLWPKRELAAAALFFVAIGVWVFWFSSLRQFTALHMRAEMTGLAAGQLGLFVICGALLIWLALSDVVRNESADAWLFALWVLGTFVFAGFLNWTCNVRSMLPIAPAFGILVVRRLEANACRPAMALSWQWALVPSFALALMVAWADRALAGSARTAAAQIVETLEGEPAPIWFQGHWGFQYYMRARGGREVDLRRPQCRPGDVMVVPYNNTDVFLYPEEFVVPVGEMAFPSCRWLSTFNAQTGAGFYSGIWGPMPFVFGPAPSERYAIWRLRLAQLSPAGRLREMP